MVVYNIILIRQEDNKLCVNWIETHWVLG